PPAPRRCPAARRARQPPPPAPSWRGGRTGAAPRADDAWAAATRVGGRARPWRAWASWGRRGDRSPRGGRRRAHRGRARSRRPPRQRRAGRHRPGSWRDRPGSQWQGRSRDRCDRGGDRSSWHHPNLRLRNSRVAALCRSGVDSPGSGRSRRRIPDNGRMRPRGGSCTDAACQRATEGSMEDDGLLYRVYERRLVKELEAYHLPQHLGVIVDGNRRWAKAAGATTAEGHRVGAAKIVEFLSWCEDLDIPLVTVWMLSTDNLSRPAEELGPLYGIITSTIEQIIEAGHCVRLTGNAEALPAEVRAVIARIQESTPADARLTVNVAIGYGGREEIVDAVRELVRDLGGRGMEPEQISEAVSVESITEHLYTRGQPDPDLIIRTSGEQRLSGFLLWQSVHAEYWFCETYWPGFRRVDLLRALRDFCKRERRFGA